MVNVVECPAGTYGSECAFTCHCPDGDTCSNVNGICSSGSCAYGWGGASCQRCEYACHLALSALWHILTGACYQQKNCNVGLKPRPAVDEIHMHSCHCARKTWQCIWLFVELTNYSIQKQRQIYGCTYNFIGCLNCYCAKIISRVCNVNLPAERLIDSHPLFRRRLKSHLFELAFN